MLEFLQPLLRMNKRQFASQALNLFLILSTALMIWKGLTIVTNSESPIVVVLSGSMEPAFYRGDLLFLSLGDDPIRVGDICVFKIKDKDIPIVHRIIKVHDDRESGKQYLLTKGDNNPVDDRGLYNPGQLWINKEDVVGKVRGFLPYVGMVTIMMNDYPQLKYALLGIMGLVVLLHKE